MSSTVADVNDVFEDDEGGLSGFTILAILATLIMVFVLVVYYAYRQGKASAIADTEELPVVAADPRPVAEDVPLDVARDDGRQEVYDRVNGAIETRIVTDENPARDALDGYSGAPAQLTQAELAAAEPEPVDPVVSALQREPVTGAATSEVPPPSRKPEAVEPAAIRTAEPVRQRASAAAVAGTHVVQVGAFDSTEAAYAYFESLAGRLGSFVASKKPDIQVAEVKGRTFHRLRIGPFGSKDEADSYCTQLKSRGQDCLVRGV